MAFPAAFLEELRNRLSLSGFVGARLSLQRAGREFKACCPFHNEKTPSFYINDDKQFYHCFGCGAHGDVIGFAMHYERLSFPEAIESLAAQAGLEVPRDTPLERERFDTEKRLYQLLDRATAWFEEQLFSSSGREALAYLKSRGLSEEAIRRFRLGYAPSDAQSLLRKITKEGYTLEELATVGLAKKAEERNDYYSFFRNRVMFPVGDSRGRTVAFGARILGEGEPKYINSPDHVLFHKGKLLYGLSRARVALAQGQPLIVVEGYMDVIALIEAGYMGAVAPLGTALTEDQIQILWKLLPPVETREASRDYSPVLCFDGDNAGIRAAARAVDKALPLLTPSHTLRLITLLGAKDPDELLRQAGKGAFDALLKQAQPMIDVIWNFALEGRSLRTPEERGIFESVLKKRTSQIKDDHLRDLYSREFKKRIDEAFAWKAPNASGNKDNKKSFWKKTGTDTPFNEARRPPQSGQRLMEKVLLALMINHPDLFDEFGEKFAELEFQASDLEQLRQNVIETLSEASDTLLNAEELRRNLEATPSSPFAYKVNTLDEVLSPDIYTHSKAARTGSTTEEARKAWLAIWQTLEQGKVKADFTSACAAYKAEPTEENEQRLEALRDKVLQFARMAE